MFGCKSGFPTPITAVVWNSSMMPNIKDNLLSAPMIRSFAMAACGTADGHRGVLFDKNTLIHIELTDQYN